MDLTLDTFDIAILAALQRNAYATHQEIGDLVHLSASQVSRRVQRLQLSGIIRRYVALLEPAVLKLGVRAITYVTLTRHSGDEGMAFEGKCRIFRRCWTAIPWPVNQTTYCKSLRQI